MFGDPGRESVVQPCGDCGDWDRDRSRGLYHVLLVPHPVAVVAVEGLDQVCLPVLADEMGDVAPPCLLGGGDWFCCLRGGGEEEEDDAEDPPPGLLSGWFVVTMFVGLVVVPPCLPHEFIVGFSLGLPITLRRPSGAPSFLVSFRVSL